MDDLYVQADDSEFYGGGDLISFLLDDNWRVFSDEIEGTDLAQELAVAILNAGLRPKEQVDHPDYSGLFRHRASSLEDSWDERAYALLSGTATATDLTTAIGTRIGRDIPDQMEVAFEDLATSIDADTIYYRARIHDDRRRKVRFESRDLGAPPATVATAGRANQKGRPALYLASNRATALAEVRPWKGAAVAVAEVKTKRRLHLVDLNRKRRLESPFFIEQPRWRVELDALLYRLAGDMSRPVMPREKEVLYRPTQLLASLIESSGYDGCLYPSAMATGQNILLFKPEEAEVGQVAYVRMKRAAYFSSELGALEDIYEEGPYDFALDATS